MILKDLDKIDWKSLKDVQGESSENIPTLLTVLASSDDKDAMEAFLAIDQKIYNQGFVAEVTPYVVPYLIDIMTNQATSSSIRIDIIELLFLIASRGVIPNPKSEYHREMWRSIGRDYDEDIRNIRIRLHNARHAVYTGMVEFWATLKELSTFKLVTAMILAQSGRPEIADEVAAALIGAIKNPALIKQAQAGFSIVYPDSESIGMALRAQLGQEQAEERLTALLDDPDPAVRQAAQKGIDKLRKQAEERLFALLDDPDPAVRQAAREGIATLHK